MNRNNVPATSSQASGSEAESERDWPLCLFAVIVDCEDGTRRTAAVFAHTAEIARLACDASAKTPRSALDARYYGCPYVAPLPEDHSRTAGVVLSVAPWGYTDDEVADCALDVLAEGISPQDVIEHLGAVLPALSVTADEALTIFHRAHYVRLVKAAQSPAVGAGLSETGALELANGCDLLGVTPHANLANPAEPRPWLVADR
jgi:hypothetical protein